MVKYMQTMARWYPEIVELITAPSPTERGTIMYAMKVSHFNYICVAMQNWKTLALF